ncbi:unnamed protein product [Ectocarpus sp. 13 AM-2016]
MHSTTLIALGFLGLQLSDVAGFHVPVPVQQARNMRSTPARMATEGTNESGLKKLTISSGDASADVFTLGGCVTSFKASLSSRVKDYDYLFVRPDAMMDGSKPISGGLPHCFPQFGPGVIQQHGFGRNLEWEVVGSTDDSVSLKLSDNEETMAMWPHPFECVYKVALDGTTLQTELTVTNTGSEDFDFQAALHSYFRCSDINKVTISSPTLDGASYLNKMKDPPATETFSGTKMTISEEVDQVFKGVTGDISINDAGNSRVLVVSNTEGWADTVIWNPYGNEGMGADNFVCVESAQVGGEKLAAGKTWTGKMKLLPA